MELTLNPVVTECRSNATVENDEDLWFADGNVIIKSQTTRFRIYKGPLCKFSPVFRETLSLPQPCVAHDDSSHVAEIALDDSPEDLRHFLKLFVGSSALRGERSTSPSYSEISAYIRLGHKYEVDTLVQDSLGYLRKYYTDDAEAWFAQVEMRPPKFEAIHAIGIVNLARLTGSDWLIPTALMGCCALGAEITRGFTREDGTRELLSLDDLGRCFAGKSKLADANTEVMHAVLKQDTSTDCYQQGRCRFVLRRLLEGFLAGEANVRELQWYESRDPFVDKVDNRHQLCLSCYKMVTETRQETQEFEIFCRLPEMLGVEVEGWASELKNKQTTVAT